MILKAHAYMLHLTCYSYTNSMWNMHSPQGKRYVSLRPCSQQVQLIKVKLGDGQAMIHCFGLTTITIIPLSMDLQHQKSVPLHNLSPYRIGHTGCLPSLYLRPVLTVYSASRQESKLFDFELKCL